LRSRIRSLALLLAVCATLAACSSKAGVTASGSASPTTASYPVTVQAGNGSVTVAARPVRIVSLSPTSTEDLFAIGAGAQVVAVDDQSDYPATAPKTSLSGFTPNVEAIAGYHPDLVVVSDDVKGLVAALKALGIPTLLDAPAATLDDAYAQITQLGTATGHLADAAHLRQLLRHDWGGRIVHLSFGKDR